MPAPSHINTFLLSGGVGSRLWPVSRKDAPKQFQRLASDDTLFEDSIKRLQEIPNSRLHLLASEAHAKQIDVLRRQFDLEPENCLLEPMGRNTAAAVALAALVVRQRANDGLVLIASSDQKINTSKKFAECVEAGIPAAESGSIVVFGIPPTRPETGFGYIEVEGEADGLVHDVARFKEKPDLVTAENFLEQGNFYWNAGIFLFKASVVEQHFKLHRPDIWQAVEVALKSADQQDALFLPEKAYAQVPSESFDVAIMQESKPIKMVEANFEWSDLGSWEAIYNIGEKDEAGNVISGDVVVSDVQNSLVWSEGPLVTAHGLKDVAVIGTKDAIFISPLKDSQQVKIIFDELTKKGRTELNVSPHLRFERGAHLQTAKAWLTEQAFPLWANSGVDHSGGGFHEVLNFDGNSINTPKRLRTMARQTYCFAIAAEREWHPQARELASHGIRFLAEQARTKDDGFAKEFSFDGKIIDDTADLYDTAFVLFAAAHSLNAQIDGARELGEEVFNRLETIFLVGDGVRGYRNFPQDKGPVLMANPIMHVLEALLAWHTASNQVLAKTRADQLINLFHKHFYSNEDWSVREVLNKDFQPLLNPKRDMCEPGHHHEWGWLLHQHRNLSKTDPALIIRRLYATANSFGRNPVTALAYQSINCNGEVLDGTSRSWPQSEAIRAAIALADFGFDNFDGEVEWRVSLLFAAHLSKAPNGMWIDSIDRAGNSMSQSVPASIFYHHVSALAAYLDHAAD